MLTLQTHNKEQLKEMLRVAEKAARPYGRIDASEPEDIVQTAMMRYLAQDRHIDNPEAYLAAIVHNEAMDLARRRTTQKHGRLPCLSIHNPEFEDSVPDNSSHSAVDLDLRSVLQDALSAVSPSHRMVLVLFAAGYTYEEIACMIGCSLGTVRSRMHHAKIRMRKILLGKI